MLIKLDILLTASHEELAKNGLLAGKSPHNYCMNDFRVTVSLPTCGVSTCEWTLACGAAASHQGFLGVVGLLGRGLPLPGAAVVQPVLEAGRGVSVEGVLQQVGPVLHTTAMPPPLPRPV